MKKLLITLLSFTSINFCLAQANPFLSSDAGVVTSLKLNSNSVSPPSEITAPSNNLLASSVAFKEPRIMHTYPPLHQDATVPIKVQRNLLLSSDAA